MHENGTTVQRALPYRGRVKLNPSDLTINVTIIARCYDLTAAEGLRVLCSRHRDLEGQTPRVEINICTHVNIAVVEPTILNTTTFVTTTPGTVFD